MPDTRSHQSTVPVIAIFTKFDNLDAEAYRALRDQGVEPERAEAEAPALADAEFDRVYLPLIQNRKHAPSAVIRLRGIPPPLCFAYL